MRRFSLLAFALGARVALGLPARGEEPAKAPSAEQILTRLRPEPPRLGIDARDRLRRELQAACKQPGELWWFLHMPAATTLADGGRTATLEQNGERLRVRILAPREARFEVLPAAPLPASPSPAGERENRGVRKVAVRLADVRDARIAVLCEPAAESAENNAPPVQPWAAR